MENMKMGEAKKLLLESLKPLEELGYKLKKSDFCVEKKEKDRTTRIAFSRINYYTEFRFIPHLEFYINKIEDIRGQFDERNHFTSTIPLKELSYWYENIEWDDHGIKTSEYFSILDYADIKNVADEIINIFLNYGVRYINEYASAEGIHKLMNSDPTNEASGDYHPTESAWWHSTGFNLQCVVGLIAAKLSGDEATYENISTIYTQRVKVHAENDTMYKHDIELFFRIKKCLG